MSSSRAEDLDELKQHLRDEVAGLVAEGFNEESAHLQLLRLLIRPGALSSSR